MSQRPNTNTSHFFQNRLWLHWASACRAAGNFFRQPISNGLILLMLAIAMMLPLSLYLMVQSSQNVLNKLNEAPQITLYLQLNAEEIAIQDLANQLKKDKRIKDVRFISKQDGLNAMQKAMSIDSDFTTLLDENPLPDAYVLTPASEQPSEVEKLQSDWANHALVESAHLDKEWLKTLWEFNQLIYKVFLFLSISLCLIFVLQAHNTIRLQILSQKEEIEITKLLGAPSSFVRRPFLYQAALQGFLATLLSIVLAQWAINSTQHTMTEMLKPYGINVIWRGFTGSEIGVILLLVVLLNIIGAWLAAQKHLLDFRKQQ